MEFPSNAIHNTFWYCHIALYTSVGQPCSKYLYTVEFYVRENVYSFMDSEIWIKFSGGDLHYHLSQHGVFSEDDVSSMKSLFNNEYKVNCLGDLNFFLMEFFVALVECFERLTALSSSVLFCQVRFYASEIILGLEHMHDRRICYRDLKVRQNTLHMSPVTGLVRLPGLILLPVHMGYFSPVNGMKPRNTTKMVEHKVVWRLRLSLLCGLFLPC